MLKSKLFSSQKSIVHLPLKAASWSLMWVYFMVSIFYFFYSHVSVLRAESRLYPPPCLIKWIPCDYQMLIKMVWMKKICQNMYDENLTLYLLNNIWLWKRGHSIKFKYSNLLLEILIMISTIFYLADNLAWILMKIWYLKFRESN